MPADVANLLVSGSQLFDNGQVCVCVRAGGGGVLVVGDERGIEPV